jgi:hypothetical protein
MDCQALRNLFQQLTLDTSPHDVTMAAVGRKKRRRADARRRARKRTQALWAEIVEEKGRLYVALS